MVVMVVVPVVAVVPMVAVVAPVVVTVVVVLAMVVMDVDNQEITVSMFVCRSLIKAYETLVSCTFKSFFELPVWILSGHITNRGMQNQSFHLRFKLWC